jgi:hypothetical protein
MHILLKHVRAHIVSEGMLITTTRLASYIFTDEFLYAAPHMANVTSTESFGNESKTVLIKVIEYFKGLLGLRVRLLNGCMYVCMCVCTYALSMCVKVCDLDVCMYM